MTFKNYENYTTISTVITEMISMHPRGVSSFWTQATENHCSLTEIQQMGAKRQRVWVQP